MARLELEKWIQKNVFKSLEGLKARCMSDLRLHIWSLLIKWNTQTRCKCSGFNEATTLSRILEFSKRTQRRKWTFKRWNIPQNKFIEKINRIEIDLSNTKQVSYMGQIKNDFKIFFWNKVRKRLILNNTWVNYEIIVQNEV